MKYTIVLREDKYSANVGKQIRQRLNFNGWIFDEKYPDLVICVGGDGTMLRAIHMYMEQLDTLQFVGIHTGTLGFFTDYTYGELENFLNDVIKNEPVIESFPLLEIQLPETKQSFYSFNEIRIDGMGKTIHLMIYIDGEFFESTAGSGICISTQCGSTGANRALSGAVVDSGLQILQLCEIMPISHHNHSTLRNPYIMRVDRKIDIKITSSNPVYAIYDHLSRELKNITQIHIEASAKKVRFARYRTYSYLTRLRNLY